MLTPEQVNTSLVRDLSPSFMTISLILTFPRPAGIRLSAAANLLAAFPAILHTNPACLALAPDASSLRAKSGSTSASDPRGKQPAGHVGHTARRLYSHFSKWRCHLLPSLSDVMSLNSPANLLMCRQRTASSEARRCCSRGSRKSCADEPRRPSSEHACSVLFSEDANLTRSFLHKMHQHFT